MELINILIILGIIYLAFLIIDKFGLYIMGIFFALLIVAFIPIMLKGLKWFFIYFTKFFTVPIEWITGYQMSIPWWYGLIILAISLLPFLYGFMKPTRGLGFN